MTSARSAPRSAPTRPRHAVLLVLLAGLAPLAWGAHLLVSYALVPVGCDLGTRIPFHLTTAITVIAALGVGATGWLLAGRGVRARDLVADTELEQGQVRPALLRLGLLLGLYFTVVIVMTGLVAVMVDPCA